MVFVFCFELIWMTEDLGALLDVYLKPLYVGNGSFYTVKVVEKIQRTNKHVLLIQE